MDSGNGWTDLARLVAKTVDLARDARAHALVARSQAVEIKAESEDVRARAEHTRAASCLPAHLPETRQTALAVQPARRWGAAAERAEPRDLQHTYPARAASVPTARDALARFAARAGASRAQIEAIRLAASEALTNVVLHAYPDGLGSVDISAAVARDELCLVIADDGCGIRPHAGRGGLGLGLVLIASLCDELQIVRRSSQGTALCLWFKLKSGTRPLAGHARGSVA